MNCVVETKGLTKTYGQLTAVDQLDLQIPRRCVYGFLGENGAGKTTTFKLLLGLQRPTQGSIRLFEQDVRSNRNNLMRRVGALIENPSLYAHLTGEEHLRMLCWMRDLPLKHIPEVLGLVGMLNRAKERTSHYSHGMKQRLGIAMALLGEPELILLDEPTNGLDPSGIRDIRELILSLPERTGATVFVSSHLLAEVERVADHLVIMRQGKRLFHGPLNELRQQAKQVITLCTPQLDRASQTLAHLKPEIKGRDKLQIPDNTCTVPDIEQLLAGEEIEITRLFTEQTSLEDVYFQMMQEPS